MFGTHRLFISSRLTGKKTFIYENQMFLLDPSSQLFLHPICKRKKGIGWIFGVEGLAWKMNLCLGSITQNYSSHFVSQPYFLLYSNFWNPSEITQSLCDYKLNPKLLRNHFSHILLLLLNCNLPSTVFMRHLHSQ